MVRRKIAKKTVLAAAAGGVLSVLVLTLYVWHLTEDVRLGYEIAQGEGRKKTLSVEIQKLQTRKAALLSLDRVERLARGELKLVDPRPEQIIYENR